MGNIFGWVVSAVLVIAVVLLVVLPVALPTPAKPSAKVLGKGFLEVYPVPPISDLIGTTLEGSGNAGDHYVQAAQIYREHEDQLKKLALPMRAARLPAQLPDGVEQIITHIRNGATRPTMSYTFVKTSKEITVEADYAPASELENVANVALNAATFYAVRANDVQRAIDICQAVAVMGWHMAEERAIADMTMKGLMVQIEAASTLGQFYEMVGQTENADAAQNYSGSLRRANSEFNAKYKVVFGTMVIPGDVFYIAENDKDRAWRVRAVLSLGMVKFSAARSADKRYNKKLIERFMEDDDPLIQAAALAARHLTKLQYRVLGT